MKITIDYKQAHGDFTLALARALNIEVHRVDVVVTPAKSLVPFCAEWRVVSKCADVVAYIDGELLQLNVI